jgi:hypothetical protein
MIEWINRHKRLIALKLVVGVMLVVAHFYPGSLPALMVNLLWLTLF